jgi:uncharacterized protein (DUF1499 family)
MARRRIADDPVSRLALWSRRLALFSLLATVLAVVIVRTGLLEIVPALATFAGSLVLAILAIVLALGAFVVIWKDGLDGAGHAFLAITISAALLAYPAYLGLRAYQLPMINDITTDPLDPPRFDVIARLRPRGTVEYAGLYSAEQQRAAYPDIEPLLVDVPPQAAYEAAMAIINKRKWRVVEDRPPQEGRRDGRIEAVARTPVMGFREDIVIRIRGNDEESRVDMRSSSRYGFHDIGSNASRIRGFLDSLEEDIDTALEREERRRPTPKKVPPPKKGTQQGTPQAKR